MDHQVIAIYSRKSRYTGAGESIENQVEMCKEYALHKFGHDSEFMVYEDEGFSGKNTARPEFQRLMRDMENNRYNILMCYRLDRISRSVSDFSTILDDLTDRGIGFVSIRENFDTSSPMGRAMIHIASVFAELERETIAERIKDNKYRLYRTGRWQGGTPPMGFTAVRQKSVDENGDKRSRYVLQPVESELPLVRELFDLYIKFGSLRGLERYLLGNHILTPGGKEFSKAVLRQILTNPVYATNEPCVHDYLQARGANLANDRREYDGQHGLIGYGKTYTNGTKNTTRRRSQPEDWIVAVSLHPGVIPGDKWIAVQSKIHENGDKYPRWDTSSIALLASLIRCGKCGAPMMVKGNRVNSQGVKTFYYKCSRKDRSAGELCDIANINGIEFDQNVIALLKAHFSEGGATFARMEQAYRTVEAERKDYTAQIKECSAKVKRNEEDGIALALRLARSSSDDTDAPIQAALRQNVAESKKLKLELEQLKRKQCAANNEISNIQIIQAATAEFCDTIDQKDFDAKREILKLVIKKITWHGDEYVIDLFNDTITGGDPGKPPDSGNFRCDRYICHSKTSNMIENAHTLGERCRAYRKLHGLTQTQFAAIVGASRSQICRIECNSNHHVGASVIDAVRLFLAKILPEKD